MKWLIGSVCVAVIANTLYLEGANATYAADRAAVEEANFNACKDAVFEAGMQGGYLGADVTKATAKTVRSDRCMLKYPQLNNPNTGSALDQAQRRARLSQLAAGKD